MESLIAALIGIALGFILYKLIINVIKISVVNNMPVYETDWTKWQVSDIIKNIVVYSILTILTIGLLLYVTL
jgi:ABC-type antimicrobial peptide transport system permease subunit